MKEKILQDLRRGAKEEYSSASGIIKLYTSVTHGDKLQVMLDKEKEILDRNEETKNLVAKARDSFVHIANASQEVSDKELKISYQVFSENKMRPHFGCRGQQVTQNLIRHAVDYADPNDD